VDVAGDDRGVLPVGTGERVRDDVLRSLVDLPLQLRISGRRRPERRPDLPRAAAEQERVRAADLLRVEALVLFVLDSERLRVPAVAMLVEAGSLHDAVERDEGGDHEPHESAIGCDIGSPSVRPLQGPMGYPLQMPASPSVGGVCAAVRLCGCAAQRTLTARHYPAALTSASSSKTGTGTKARTPEMVGAAETQAG
jgi:hypothetical protein